jgi:phosphinothricin acetyltransferase
MRIREIRPDDAAAVRDIYGHYIAQTVATFEEEPVAVEEMRRRIGEVSAKFPWLVAEEDGELAGYAYATSWKSRSAYRNTVESTVYLRAGLTGRGIGSALYAELIDELRRRGVRCVIGGITLPNAASVALHEKLGFEAIGRFREVGFKFGRWLDVGYWQLLLDAEPTDH